MVKVGNKVEVTYTYTGVITNVNEDGFYMDSSYWFIFDDPRAKVTVLAEPLPDTEGTVIKNVHTEDGCHFAYVMLLDDRWHGLCETCYVMTSVHGDDITKWESLEDED